MVCGLVFEAERESEENLLVSLYRVNLWGESNVFAYFYVDLVLFACLLDFIVTLRVFLFLFFILMVSKYDFIMYVLTC